MNDELKTHHSSLHLLYTISEAWQACWLDNRKSHHKKTSRVLKTREVFIITPTATLAPHLILLAAALAIAKPPLTVNLSKRLSGICHEYQAK